MSTGLHLTCMSAANADGEPRRLRIMIVTDAWTPQINGVVITLRNTIRELERCVRELKMPGVQIGVRRASNRCV